MTKMLIDIDEALLAAARELLGAESNADTVNTALRQTVQRLARRRALSRLAERGKQGNFDDLLDKAVYRAGRANSTPR